VVTVFSAESQHRNLSMRKVQEIQSEYLINIVGGDRNEEKYMGIIG
jgi:hypothetical protein